MTAEPEIRHSFLCRQYCPQRGLKRIEPQLFDRSAPVLGRSNIRATRRYRMETIFDSHKPRHQRVVRERAEEYEPKPRPRTGALRDCIDSADAQRDPF